MQKQTMQLILSRMVQMQEMERFQMVCPVQTEAEAATADPVQETARAAAVDREATAAILPEAIILVRRVAAIPDMITAAIRVEAATEAEQEPAAEVMIAVLVEMVMEPIWEPAAETRTIRQEIITMAVIATAIPQEAVVEDRAAEVIRVRCGCRSLHLAMHQRTYTMYMENWQSRIRICV